jgi:hypothetical protein
MLRITANPCQTYATQGEVGIPAERAGARDPFSALSFKEIMKSFPVRRCNSAGRYSMTACSPGLTLEEIVIEDCKAHGVDFRDANVCRGNVFDNRIERAKFTRDEDGRSSRRPADWGASQSGI